MSRYYPPTPTNNPGTLYSANMLALPGVASQGVGSATLRVSAAGTQAILSFSINNLMGLPTGESINSDPYLANPGELIFDISAAKPQADGSYLWTIKPTGLNGGQRTSWKSSTKARPLSSSRAAAFPNGEISGNFTLANGSQTFTPPPAPPQWTDDCISQSNAECVF